ncbi:MAG: hypothetical protein OXL38_13515, partial [Gammaproteobacteria bacterium]|nr:hypothetical protein [Gammaproteobacteria bacterium]
MLQDSSLSTAAISTTRSKGRETRWYSSTGSSETCACGDFHAQALADSYRVVRCDMRGFGRSTTEHVEFAYW